MKKVFTFIAAALFSVTALGQTKVLVNGVEYDTKSEEYKQMCIEYYNSKVGVTPKSAFIAVFVNEDSFNEYRKGQALFASGIAVSLVSSGVIWGGIYAQEKTIKNFLYITGAVGGVVGFAMTTIGVFKWNHWAFNGTGFTCTF